MFSGCVNPTTSYIFRTYAFSVVTSCGISRGQLSPVFWTPKQVAYFLLRAWTQRINIPFELCVLAVVATPCRNSRGQPTQDFYRESKDVAHLFAIMRFPLYRCVASSSQTSTGFAYRTFAYFLRREPNKLAHLLRLDGFWYSRSPLAQQTLNRFWIPKQVAGLSHVFAQRLVHFCFLVQRQ